MFIFITGSRSYLTNNLFKWANIQCQVIKLFANFKLLVVIIEVSIRTFDSLLMLIFQFFNKST